MKKATTKNTEASKEFDDVELASSPRRGKVAFQTPPRTIDTTRDDDIYDVSPADTFETALTSPTRTFDNSDIGSPPAKITIDHTFHKSLGSKSSKTRTPALDPVLRIAKPVVCVILVLLFLTSGGAAYLLKQFLTIPGLKGQVKLLEEQVGELTSQIQRMSAEVDRLESENDRYASLNSRLSVTVGELQGVNDDLNSTAISLADTAYELNLTKQELVERVNDLELENEEYKQLNQQLTDTTTELQGEVTRFQTSLQQMEDQNAALEELSKTLQESTFTLGNLTVEQNATIAQLNQTLDTVKVENDRLESLNNDLVTITSFLNDTAGGLDESLEQVTTFLADQIVANQVLVRKSLENTYLQRTANWDCDYREIFRSYSFGQDFTEPIDDLSLVLPYIEDRVLSEICLDVSDFESYLTRTYSNNITSYRLTRAVLVYTTEALDYYFPEQGETGLTPQDWADASYDCQNLSTPFTWDLIPNNGV